MKFEGWYLWFLRIFCSTLTNMTDKVEVVFLGFCLRDPKTCAMLPDIAFLASDAV